MLYNFYPTNVKFTPEILITITLLSIPQNTSLVKPLLLLLLKGTGEDIVMTSVFLFVPSHNWKTKHLTRGNIFTQGCVYLWLDIPQR